MQKVDFYILERAQSDADIKLACQIADKAFAQGMRIYIHSESEAQAEMLDKALWTFRQDSFLPHAQLNTEEATQSPIIIGHQTPEGIAPEMLINLSADTQPWFSGFDRIAEIVPASETSKQAGRDRFRWYRDLGHTPTTHTIH